LFAKAPTRVELV